MLPAEVFQAEMKACLSKISLRFIPARGNWAGGFPAVVSAYTSYEGVTGSVLVSSE